MRHVALDEVLGQVTPEYLDALRRSDTLGDEDFSEAVEAYLFVREVASTASMTDARYLKPEALQSMELFLIEIRDTTAPQIEAFSWSDEGAAAARGEIIRRANEMREYARRNGVRSSSFHPPRRNGWVGPRRRPARQ